MQVGQLGVASPMAVAFVALMATSRPAAAQGNAKRENSLYRPEVFGVQDLIAGKVSANPLDGVGAKISAAEHVSGC